MHRKALMHAITLPIPMENQSTDALDVTRSIVFSRLAPAITGIAIKKEIRDAACREKPNKRAIVIVTPDRDAPGINAKH